VGPKKVVLIGWTACLFHHVLRTAGAASDIWLHFVTVSLIEARLISTVTKNDVRANFCSWLVLRSFSYVFHCTFLSLQVSSRDRVTHRREELGILRVSDRETPRRLHDTEIRTEHKRRPGQGPPLQKVGRQQQRETTHGPTLVC